MKIICVGRNYADHAKELGNDIPDEPVIFMKPKSALLQSHTPFYYPEFSNELHYECELVLRVCKSGKYIQERHASNYYNGITVGIDFIDLTPASNRKNINFTFYKNKELVQTGNSANMIFSIDSIIAHISNYFSLNIGDLIFTGTPAGVGECVVGDLLEAFLEKENLLTVEVK